MQSQQWVPVTAAEIVSTVACRTIQTTHSLWNHAIIFRTQPNVLIKVDTQIGFIVDQGCHEDWCATAFCVCKLISESEYVLNYNIKTLKVPP